MIKEYIKGLIDTGLCSTTSEVLSHFKDIGIDSNVSGKYIQLKYNTFFCTWKTPLPFHCRGVILDVSDISNPRYVATPFMKFFNYGEPKSKYTTFDDIKKFIANGGKLTQKADGTCIVLYYTFDRGWKVSTLGTIDPLNVNDNPITFSELFWKQFDLRLSTLRIGTTYIFELCTELNQIVTKYDDRKIFFLSALREWKYDLPAYLEVAKEIELGNTKIELPKVEDVPLEIDTIDKFTSFVKEKFYTGLGRNPEGVVGTLNGIPQFKWKFPEYLTLHKTMTGDEKYVRKSLIHHLFNGTLDDIISELTSAQIEFIDTVKTEIKNISNYYSSSLISIYFEGMSQKEFALSINKFRGKYPFDGYMFLWFKDKISFYDFLIKGNTYEKNMDFFKAL